MRNNYSLSKVLNIYSFTVCNNFLKKFPKKPLVVTSSKKKKKKNSLLLTIKGTFGTLNGDYDKNCNLYY